MPDLSFTEAIRDATEIMLQDPKFHVFGLGATYRNGLDGTMADFGERYPNQVHDMPCSEAAITGMALGAALAGLRPLVHHGRIEFALFAANFILTEAANWNYTFRDYPCPLIMRIAVGRQWGNGAAHTRSMRSLFAVPGLHVVVPSSPVMAKCLLLTASRKTTPVIYLEPRWLYKLRGDVLTEDRGVSFKPFPLREGEHVTIVGVGEMALEATRAADHLREQGIRCEVIDLVSVYPVKLDPLIRESVAKTGHLIVADATPAAYSVCNEITSAFQGVRFGSVTCAPSPCPTAPSLSANYYPTATEIVQAVGILLEREFVLPPQRTFAELHLPPTR